MATWANPSSNWNEPRDNTVAELNEASEWTTVSRGKHKPVAVDDVTMPDPTVEEMEEWYRIPEDFKEGARYYNGSKSVPIPHDY